jgi:HK97 family phage portal protein
MGIYDRIKAASTAFRFPSGITHRAGSFLSLAPRTFPYENTDPLGDSAVVNVLAWIQRNFVQAEFEVYRELADDEDETIDNHPLTRLMDRPNAGYDAQALWAGTLLSYHLDGNAYWIKARNARGFGVPTEIWYEPHCGINPHWPEDGSAFIDYYERRINGTIERIPVENVVHFRNGINPANPRYGLAPLKAALLQVFTDTEVSLWVAALCRNMAIPGVIVSPTEPIGMTESKADQIKQTWKRKFGGDSRGEPLILDFQADIKTLGYDPKQMDFGSITNLAESRISGAMGVPAIVAGLSAGLDSSTYSNLENLKKSAFEECLIPTWKAFEKTVERYLLPDFERDVTAISCEFDTSEIRALQENQSEKEIRAIAAFQAGVTTLNEARAQFGYDPMPSGDYHIMSSSYKPIVPDVAMAMADLADTPTPATIQPQQGESLPLGPADEESGAKYSGVALLTKSIEWNGLTLRRQPTELEARMIKQIDEAYQSGKLSMNGQLLAIRGKYVSQIVDELDGLDPEDYYTATVKPDNADRQAVIAILAAIFLRGARLIVEELRNQGGGEGDPSARPDARQTSMVAGALISKVANDVQARGTGAAVSAALLGQDVRSTVQRSLDEGSTAYVTRAASEATNRALADGRDAEIERRSDEIEYLVYSAVLDNATCRPCGESDGLGGQLGSIPDVPNPDCDGGANCRCLHIPVVAQEFEGAKGKYRGVEIDMKPTSGMKSEAQKGLDWRKEFGRGGTAIGIARARDIVNGRELSADTVKRMYSFFSRHEVDKQGQGFSPGEDGYPSNGRIAWALWGGDAGFAWSKKLVKRFETIDEEK